MQAHVLLVEMTGVAEAAAEAAEAAEEAEAEAVMVAAEIAVAVAVAEAEAVAVAHGQRSAAGGRSAERAARSQQSSLPSPTMSTNHKWAVPMSTAPESSHSIRGW